MEEDASSYKKNANFFSQKIILETVTWSHAPYSSCIRAASPWPLSRHSQSTRRECTEKDCVLPPIILWVVNVLFNTPWIKNFTPNLWPYWGLASSVGRPSGKKLGDGACPWRGDWDLSFSLILAPEAKQASPSHHVPIITHRATTSLHRRRMKLGAK